MKIAERSRPRQSEFELILLTLSGSNSGLLRGFSHRKMTKSMNQRMPPSVSGCPASGRFCPERENGLKRAAEMKKPGIVRAPSHLV